jgi:hypothetical protein
MTRSPVRSGLVLATVLALLAARATHADTLLRMTSDPGDWVGAGQSYLFTPDNATFTMTGLFGRGIRVRVQGATDDFTLELMPPKGETFPGSVSPILYPGVYEGAVRYPFQAAIDPGISISGDGRGCNEITGTFEVRESFFGAVGIPVTLWATFEQHCEGGAPKLVGEIRVDADTALYVRSPADVYLIPGQHVAFTVDAHDTRGFTGQALTALGLPAGATFDVHPDATGDFLWTAPVGPFLDAPSDQTVQFLTNSPHGGGNAVSITRLHVLNPKLLDMTSDVGDYIGQGQTYHLDETNASFTAQRNFDAGVSLDVAGSNQNFHLDFAAPGNVPLAVGGYAGAARFPLQNANQPGLSVYGDGRGCNTLTGSFNVKQITWGTTPDGDVESFLASFVQHCEGMTPALTGQVMFQLDHFVPTLASVVASDASPTGVHLRWYSSTLGGAAVTVRRRTDGSPWATVGTIRTDGSGFLDLVDADVVPGSRYAYRLERGTGLALQYNAEVWIDVPRASDVAFALEPIEPNPAKAAELRVSFTLPASASASLDLLDVAGRSIARQAVGSVTAGRHTVTLANLGGVRPGFYAIRLSAGGRTAVRRALIVR